MQGHLQSAAQRAMQTAMVSLRQRSQLGVVADVAWLLQQQQEVLQHFRVGDMGGPDVNTDTVRVTGYAAAGSVTLKDVNRVVFELSAAAHLLNSCDMGNLLLLPQLHPQQQVRFFPLGSINAQ